MSETGNDLHWVFGFGSLMWLPDFDYVERRPALLRGYHRAFSIESYESWGSQDKPGLVVALHPGGQCRGIAIGVAAAAWPAVERYLQHRERAYRHRYLEVVTDAGSVRALTFLYDPDHPRAVGKLNFQQTVIRIGQGHGRVGRSRDYLGGIIRELEAIGSRPNKLLKKLHKLSKI